MTLVELVQREAELARGLAQIRLDFEKESKSLEAQISEVQRLRAMAGVAVDLDKIALGETVVWVTGDAHAHAPVAPWGGSPHNQNRRMVVVEDAINDLAISGGKRLRDRYFGVKNYDRFGDQREDHYYGYGPRHGHIVFSVDLMIKDRPLTLEEIEAGVYLLEQIKANRYVAKKRS